MKKINYLILNVIHSDNDDQYLADVIPHLN